jgi:uncharacterized protein (DUF736 family)
MRKPSFACRPVAFLLLAALLPAPLVAQDDLGTLEITRDGERIVFDPDEQPEYRIRINRKGEERLLAGWRRIEDQGRRVIIAQLAAPADGKGKFGLMIAIERDGEFRNYSTGCSPDRKSPCDPATFGLSLDLAMGTLTVTDAEFRRDSLDDGPDADQRIRASGVLRLTGAPQRD